MMMMVMMITIRMMVLMVISIHIHIKPERRGGKCAWQKKEGKENVEALPHPESNLFFFGLKGAL